MRRTEVGGTLTYFTCKRLVAQNVTLELGKMIPSGTNDLSPSAVTDAAIWA